ncbi:MAG: Trp family transcriptional regulator [Candidatus Peribacteraceae bacterium]|nr:Trp family transcriptional regulator [Candidatus Peribacteraceae bacterium]
MAVPPKHLRDVFELFASVSNAKEAEMLLRDILTPQELESVAERWQLVRELVKGTPQREIAEKLNLSISKITRGSRQLQYGSGGFGLFLGKRGGK